MAKNVSQKVNHFLIDVENGCYRKLPNDIVDDDEKINNFIWEEFSDPCSPILLVKQIRSFSHKFVAE